jgi:hypothetical protein
MNFQKLTILLSSLLLPSLFYQTFLLSQGFVQQIRVQKEIEKISREIETLRVSVSLQNSLSNLENFVKEKNLVKGNQIKFVEVLEGKTASK